MGSTHDGKYLIKTKCHAGKYLIKPKGHGVYS